MLAKILILGDDQLTAQCQTLTKAMKFPAIISHSNPYCRDDIEIITAACQIEGLDEIWITTLGVKKYADYFQRLAFFGTLKDWLSEKAKMVKMILLESVPDEFLPQAEKIFDLICFETKSILQDIYNLLINSSNSLVTAIREVRKMPTKVLVLGSSYLTEQIRTIAQATKVSIVISNSDINFEDIQSVVTTCQIEKVEEVWITTLGVPQTPQFVDFLGLHLLEEKIEDWTDSLDESKPNYHQRLEFFRTLKNFLRDRVGNIKMVLFEKIPEAFIPEALTIFEMIYIKERLQIAHSLLAGFPKSPTITP